jgi:hypothetical protein
MIKKVRVINLLDNIEIMISIKRIDFIKKGDKS